MKIDPVSTKLIKFALYLNDLKPGVISEIWLEPDLLQDLMASVPTKDSIQKLLEELKNEIRAVNDRRRKRYLEAVTNSLTYQHQNLKTKQVSLEEYTQNCFGITIPRITDEDLTNQERRIKGYEEKIGQNRHQVLNAQEIEGDEIKTSFLANLGQAKQLVASKLPPLPDQEQFQFKTVRGESWSAFNKHIAPYHSELIVNLDHPVNVRESRYLAFHEGYGGHHSELCLKDRLLIEEGRGEHGFVITCSPQTFISEALAVNAQTFFDTKYLSDEEKLISAYDELTGGLLFNRVAYMYYQDTFSKNEIRTYLDSFDITSESKEFVLKFATDPTYGIYTLVYHFAGKFLSEKYAAATDKSKFLNDMYTLPTTPDMLFKD